MEEKENVVVTDEVKSATKNPADLKLNYPQTLKVGLGFAVVMIFWTVSFIKRRILKILGRTSAIPIMEISCISKNVFSPALCINSPPIPWASILLLVSSLRSLSNLLPR